MSSTTTTTAPKPKANAPKINTSTSSSTTTIINDDNLASALTDNSPQSPTAHQRDERGMSITADWKPAMDRRQSFSAQEYKHEQHKYLGSREHHVRGGALGEEQGFTSGVE